MSAFNGIYKPESLDGSICSECGDSFPEIDEATELCDHCFEQIFGELPSDEDDESGSHLKGNEG